MNITEINDKLIEEIQVLLDHYVEEKLLDEENLIELEIAVFNLLIDAYNVFYVLDIAKDIDIVLKPTAFGEIILYPDNFLTALLMNDVLVEENNLDGVLNYNYFPDGKECFVYDSEKKVLMKSTIH